MALSYYVKNSGDSLCKLRQTLEYEEYFTMLVCSAVLFAYLARLFHSLGGCSFIHSPTNDQTPGLLFTCSISISSPWQMSVQFIGMARTRFVFSPHRPRSAYSLNPASQPPHHFALGRARESATSLSTKCHLSSLD